MRRSLAVMTLGVLAACSTGSMPTSPGNGAGAETIDVNLTLNAPSKTLYGLSGGYAPAVTTVPVGSHIRFMNTDNFEHTATLIPNAKRFPSGSPFGISSLMQHGATLSGGFSSGALQVGTLSQIITADRPGTYLFGCFYHYSAPMRGTIVAQ